MSPMIGPPDSIRRQVIFGIAIGLIAGFVAGKFDLDLPLVTTLAAIISTLAAGYGPTGGTAVKTR